MTVEIQTDGRLIFIENDFRRVIEPHKTRDLVGLNLTIAETKVIMDKWATIPVPEPDPVIPPPTNDEIYDRVIQNQPVFKGYVLALNDGSIVPGSNMTGAEIKAAVKAKM